MELPPDSLAIIDASSTMKSVSCLRLTSFWKTSISVMDFCRYIFLCIVYAGAPAYEDKTLAARPVGASSMMRCPSCCIVRTKAARSDVLPVPA